MRRRVLGILLAAVMLSSCGGTTDAPLEPCDAGGVFPAASAGLTPDFTWSPQCLAAALLVSDSGGTIVWAIEADISIIAPGIGYGELPTDVNETTPPVTLVDNRSYAVGVYRRDINGDLSVIGAAAFRP